MDDRIRNAFGCVEAEDALKRNTAERLREKTGGFGRKHFRSVRMAVSFACAAAVFTILISGYFFAVPVYAIDLNAEYSVEMKLNRMDRVISITGLNEDGRVLADSVKVMFMKYSDALAMIMGNAKVKESLDRNREVTISVIGEDEEKSEEMKQYISSCMYARNPNVTCMCGNKGEVQGANEAGLPFGKYKAFLELKKYDPDVTAETIRHMTMREIRDRIRSLSGED